MEVWKDIHGYEGLYQVSNLGRVRSLNWRNTGEIRELCLKPHNRGYLQIELTNRGIKKTFTVHRLVALHFVQGFQDGFVVNHINENKTDNRADNLEWISQSENTDYSYARHSSVRERSRKNIRPVVQIAPDGSKTIWDCILAVVRGTGFNAWSIKQCCEGKRKQAYGYKWQYAALNIGGRETALTNRKRETTLPKTENSAE